MINIAKNIAHINHKIDKACQNANRPVNSVALLAVSKTKPCSLIEQAYADGQRQFGENYIQEAVEKIQQLTHLNDISWHFIGPVQSNKTKQIASLVDWIHSVDRIKIAKRLNEQRDANITPLNVCLQVNISSELSKSGATIDELFELAEYVNNCPNLCLRGLMAIPEKTTDTAKTKNSFIKMQTLFNKLKHQYPTIDTLSMGMSGDLNIAIESGSTMVRIGTAIFGLRD